MRSAAIFKATASDRGGSVAMIFAISLFPVLMAIGVAIDYARAIRTQGALQNSADAAVLAAIAPGMKPEKARAVASAVFQEGLTDDVRIQLAATPSVDINVLDGNDQGKIQSTLDFEAAVKTAVLSFAGIDEIKVRGHSEARTGVNKYIDIHVLLDTSDSMGLAASDADRLALRRATAAYKMQRVAEIKAADPAANVTNVLYTDSEDGSAYKQYWVADAGGGKGYSGCEFACHVGNIMKSSKSTQDIAAESGIRLRMDVARDGIAEVATLAEAARRENSYIRMGLHAFSTNLQSILPATADLTAFRNNIANPKKVNIGTAGFASSRNQADIRSFYGKWNSCWYPYANTFFDYVVPSYTTYLNDFRGKAASGQTNHETPMQVVLLVTDGLKSQNCAASQSKDDVYPFRPADCAKIKATGAKLAIIYTEYSNTPISVYVGHARHAVEEAQNYNYKDRTKSSGVEKNLRECASEGFFLKGDQPHELDAAFKQMFENIKVAAYIRR
jgi:Flp pilus assembly protein TadG